jgi:carbamoyltransferase
MDGNRTAIELQNGEFFVSLIILGINAYHGDASACLIRDGKLIAAAEEERFRRVKHWAGFPIEAIKYCLAEAGVSIDQIDHIALNRNPSANLLKKALFAFAKRPSLAAVTDRLKNAGKLRDVSASLASGFDVPASDIKAKIHNVEHHLAHLASAFFVSPYEEAAVVSVDGFGDFASTMWGIGRKNQIELADRTYFPHSLGLFYQAITQYLGFPHYGDEYKVMGLAPYGEALEVDKMRKIVRLLPEGRFELSLDYFVHHSEGVSMVWDNGEPTIGRVFSAALEELFGEPMRTQDQALEARHWNIAASAQAMYEEAFFHILNHVQAKTGLQSIALAGGCAMNSVANGKILQKTDFKNIYIQSAAGDAGGAIGAAFAVWNQELKQPRSFEMTHAYWGPEYSAEQIRGLLDQRAADLETQVCRVTQISDEAVLCHRTAEAIAKGQVIGWFQGRMEWGPRALGNRSILGDPRRADMKDILNLKIKRRESFRPFAPSILRENVKDWFETDYDVPFMLQVFQIIETKRAQIPAVTHVNGSGRLQTVTTAQNARYHRLIAAFGEITGVPILLNTSFNENEPVVCRPEEALNCFLRTKMDVLVLGDFLVERIAAE